MVKREQIWLPNKEYLNVVNNGLSGTQPPTKSLLILGLNISPEDYGLGKAQEGT